MRKATAANDPCDPDPHRVDPWHNLAVSIAADYDETNLTTRQVRRL